MREAWVPFFHISLSKSPRFFFQSLRRDMVISIKYNEPKGSTIFLLNETRQPGESLQQLGTFPCHFLFLSFQTTAFTRFFWNRCPENALPVLNTKVPLYVIRTTSGSLCVKVGNVLIMFLRVWNWPCFLNEFSLTSMVLSLMIYYFFKKHHCLLLL